jgi:RNA 2',3'-cyclic 3'-phosphodiesterase
MAGSLFAGWRPEAGGRERLARIVAALDSARPADAVRAKARRPDQWHVTLCFIGQDVEPARAAAAREALAQVGGLVPPHAVRIERIAHWPGSGAVVALPAPSGALRALCDACDTALQGAGIAPAQATTQPHLTLAYLPKRLPLQHWCAAVDCGGAELLVQGFELLWNAGGRYEALAAWPLRGPPLAPAPRQDDLPF